MKRSGFKRKPPIHNPVEIGSIKPRKAMKSKQCTVTSADKSYWSELASIGCIACRIDGKENPFVSIHHVDGRTKDGCHRKVLPLCAGHHQDGTGNDKTMIAVHPYKAAFSEHYGSQESLIEMCRKILEM